MKPIKFRAWHKPSQGMWDNVHEDYSFWEMINSNEYVIMQWLGITDWWGQDMYEGDIVLQRHWFGNMSKAPKNRPFILLPGIVKYHLGEPWVSPQYLAEYGENYWDIQHKYQNKTDWYRGRSWMNHGTIIGNIYQNPELMEIDYNMITAEPPLYRVIAYFGDGNGDAADIAWENKHREIVTLPMSFGDCKDHVYKEVYALASGFGYNYRAGTKDPRFVVEEFKHRI